MKRTLLRPLSVHWLWIRLGETISSVREDLLPEAAWVIDQVNQFLSRYEQMTGDRIPAPGERPPQSDEWWKTDAEASELLLDRMERGMTAIGEPPSLEFYRLGMRLALLVARIEADGAEYFQRKSNDMERSLNM